jgi:hypothetical protein
MAMSSRYNRVRFIDEAAHRNHYPQANAGRDSKTVGIPKKDVTRLQKLVDEWAWNPETISKFGEPL